MQGKFGVPGGASFGTHGDSSDSSMRNNVYTTPGIRNPQSRKSVVEDEDIPNTDEFPSH